jgi:hypothetical protein
MRRILIMTTYQESDIQLFLRANVSTVYTSSSSTKVSIQFREGAENVTSPSIADAAKFLREKFVKAGLSLSVKIRINTETYPSERNDDISDDDFESRAFLNMGLPFTQPPQHVVCGDG